MPENPASDSRPADTVSPLTSAATGQQAGTDTLFFDGRCPLCAGEIAQLRETRGDELALVDIHTLTDTPRPSSGSATGPMPNSTSGSIPGSTPGFMPSSLPDKDTLLRTLHLQRADGAWLTGADANVAAWEGTRHGRLLGVLRWPLIRHAVDVVYKLWAIWRYRKLYGAQYHADSPQPRATD